MTALRALAALVVAGTLLTGLPAQARPTAKATYVAPASNGYFYQRNLPNPEGALGEGEYGYGGYTFMNVKTAPLHVKVVDELAGKANIPYTICQPNCDGLRIEGCTPGTGKVSLTGFTARENVLVYIHAYDPAFRACEGNTTRGTLTLTMK